MNTKTNAEVNKVILALGRGIKSAYDPTTDTRKVSGLARTMRRAGRFLAKSNNAYSISEEGRI